MFKWILTICIILAFIPMAKPAIAATAAPTVMRDAGISFSVEETLKDITGVKKQPINGSALAALKKELAKDGWKASGKMFYRSGKWLLRFSRSIVQASGEVFMPNMYVDKTGNCIRYRSNNQPVPGMPCDGQG